MRSWEQSDQSFPRLPNFDTADKLLYLSVSILVVYINSSIDQYELFEERIDLG